MKLIYMAIAWLATVVLVIGAANTFSARDDTDPPDGRSGLMIYTDNLTGCQYLRASILGGITPRMFSDGVHVCITKEPEPE